MAIMASGAPPRDPSQLVPAGGHIAICTKVVDVGVQPGGKFDPQRQVYIGWELPNLPLRKWKDKDGNEHQGPQGIGNFYTLSLGAKAKLRGVLESWRGKAFSEEEVKGFNIAVILGRVCMLNVVHNTAANGQTYANVGVVMAPPAGTVAKTTSTLLEYSVDAPNEGLLMQLPKFLRDRIAQRIVPKPMQATAPARAGAQDPWSTPPQGATASSAQPELATAGVDDDDIPF